MNKVEEQAKLVQDALRAGKMVAVVVARQAWFELVVPAMIPEDLEIQKSYGGRIRFKNGAGLAFIPAYAPDALRIRWGLCLYRFSDVEDYPSGEKERLMRTVLSSEIPETYELELP